MTLEMKVETFLAILQEHLHKEISSSDTVKRHLARLLNLSFAIPFFEFAALLPLSFILAIGMSTRENDRIEKTCQHSAMKQPRQNKRAPQTHQSALSVPSYHRILVKHGLIEKTLSIPEAYEMFLKVGADQEVQKLRRKVARGNKMKHVPALYLATAMALQGMTKQEIEALKLRIEEKRG